MMTRRWIGLAMIAGGVMAGCTQKDDRVWMLAYFRTPAEALHVAYSEDGLTWTALNGNRPVLEATVGNRSIRDPFIRQGHDGAYHLLSTNSWKSHCFIHTQSRDLIHWEPQRLIPIMESVPETRNVWAPEFILLPGGEEYLAFWSSVTVPEGHQRIWCARTKDFVTWSPPTVLFDPGYMVIDATIVRGPDAWVMLFKDERGTNDAGTDNKGMRVATAPAPTGPWGDVSDLVTPHLTEGPAVFETGGRWLMLYDHFMESRWGAAESDDLQHWRVLDQGLTVPPEARHGSVFQVPRSLLERLMQKWPTTTANT
jgi:beta-xylosidase